MTNFKTETVSSLTDLITKLDTWMATVGWTAEHLDTTATAGTGGEWAMRRTAGATNLRFATSWDGAGTIANMAIYHYVDQNYVIASRPWGQANDSGNGLQASSPNSSIINERHVILTNTPIRYWAFEGTIPSDFTYIIVETAVGEYAHFGFGLLDKLGGDWTGGEFVYGQRNNLSGFTGGEAEFDGMSFLLDGHFNDTADGGGPTSGAELLAATVHAEGMPNGPTSHKFAVSVGGATGGSRTPQAVFGNDRQGTPRGRVMFTWGLRNGPYCQAYHRSNGSDLSGEMRFWPVGSTYVDTTTTDIYGTPIGFMPEVFGCNIKNYVGADVIIDDEGSRFHVFPANKKWPGSGTGSTGYLGIAYKVDADPPLPSSINDPTGWYSSSSSKDYTRDGLEFTQLNDKSGNGNHMTVPSAKTGPSYKIIDNRSWMEFPVGADYVLSGPNLDVNIPDDCTFAAVFRSVNDGSPDAGAMFGKVGGGDANYNLGMFLARTNGRSLYWQMRDTVLANTLQLEHDDAGSIYTDGTSRVCAMTYDDGLADAFLYGNDFTSSVDSDLVYASVAISPTNDFYIGDWSNAYNRPFHGEIAEIIVFDRVLTSGQMGVLETFLKSKWGITT